LLLNQKTEHITIPKNTAVFYTLKRKRGSAEIVPSLDIPMQRTSFDFDARFAECWKIELAGMNFIYNITGMNAESNML
jgi:hypothetical protein